MGRANSNWYFSKEDLDKSPSRMDGVQVSREDLYRSQYCAFLHDLGIGLKVPQVTIATAIVFCHRFFVRQSHARNDRLTVASACMFLAAKVEETFRRSDAVVKVGHKIRYKDAPHILEKLHNEEYIAAQREIIFKGEMLVLQTISFNISVYHPYKPLITLIKMLNDQGTDLQGALAQIAWNFVNDGYVLVRFLLVMNMLLCSLRTTLCLQFEPEQIAAGAVFLAAKFLKANLSCDSDKAWWHGFGLSLRQLQEVGSQLLERYEEPKPKAAVPVQVEELPASENDSKRSSPGEVVLGPSPDDEVKSEVKKKRADDSDSAAKRKRFSNDAPGTKVAATEEEAEHHKAEATVEEGELPASTGGSPLRLERQQLSLSERERRGMSPNERRYERKREFYGRDTLYGRRDRDMFYDNRPPHRDMPYRQQQQQHRDYYPHHHHQYHQEQHQPRQVEWHRPPPPPPREGWIERENKRARYEHM